MRVLITGGAGFIGSHLAERLLSDGHHVTIIDNLSTGSYENVAALESDRNFVFFRDTVFNSGLVERVVSECDSVFHLACAVGVKLIMERPVETVESIFQGTAVVLNVASRYRKRVLITSTSEVYGKSQDVPFTEDGDRIEGSTQKHRWAYAAAKALDEFLALAHWKEFRLPVIITRLFNTVGPRQTGQYGMVLPTFVNKALTGQDLLVHGDGTQSRCFCHVGDVTDALIKLMECPQARGRVINVGSAEEISILDLAKKVIGLTGSSSRIRMVPYENVYGEGFEDMARRIPSLERVRSLIGWKPLTSLDAIINDIIIDMKSRALMV